MTIQSCAGRSCNIKKKGKEKAVKLKEVNINSERYFKSKIRATQKIESISKSDIEFQNFQNTADLLQNSGSLAVQKSQQGGGSPIIRGFEANRILLLIDGVRMKGPLPP